MQKKEIMIKLPNNEQSNDILKVALKNGFKLFYTESIIKNETKKQMELFSPHHQTDIQILNFDEIETRDKNKPFAIKLQLNHKDDEEKAEIASSLGAKAIIVETPEWRIIPLENLVSKLHKTQTQLFTPINNLEEISTMFKILEIGVDGVIFSPENIEDLNHNIKIYSEQENLDLKLAVVTEKKDIGIGDRVCIDTASILNSNEGMLIGSQSNFLFLIKGETEGSKFSAARPFRVNAGPVHSYTLLPDGKTKYLSEIESGTEIMLVNNNGKRRSALVGRAKIENRPLTMIKAKVNNKIGKYLAQNAETISFIGENNKHIPVTELKINDKILVYVAKSSGRHFGVEVDEFVIEK